MKIRILASIAALIISGASYAYPTRDDARDNGISASDTTGNQEWENVCRAGIHSFSPIQRVINPYSFAGKCYLYNFDEATIGSAHIQWLGPNKLLEIITAYNDSPLTILYQSDEPIDLSKIFLAVGVQPEQYQDTLGSIRTPITFRILAQGVTDEINRYFEETKKSEAAREERERRKSLRPPAYLTDPESKDFVNPCLSADNEYPDEARADGIEGHVEAKCHFTKDDDNYWRGKSCRFTAPKGTDKDFIKSARNFMAAKCWTQENFGIDIDSAGIGTAHIDYTMSDE